MLSHRHPSRQMCRGLSCPRRGHSYQARRRDETWLKAAIERLAGAWPTDGDRRITALLPREHVPVHRQHVARLMRERGLQGHRPAHRPRPPASGHASPRYRHWGQGWTLMRPDHVWGAAMTYGRVRTACVYWAVWREVDTRAMRGGHRRRHLDQTRTFTAWRRALGQGQPAIQHADQGVQDAASASIPRLHARGVPIRMATVGEATEHGDAERLMRTMQDEEGALHDEADFHTAYHRSGRFLDAVAQHKRMQAA
jgi:putative transposase